MSSPQFTIVRAAQVRPFPALVRSKLTSLVNRIHNDEWTTEALSRNIKTLNDQLDRNLFEPPTDQRPWISKEDLATIRDRLFMADIYVCMGMRPQAAEQAMDAAAIVSRSLMGPLLVRKRLFNPSSDLGSLDALPGSARLVLESYL